MATPSNDKLKEHLMALGAECLSNKLIEIATYDKIVEKELEFLVLKKDSKKLAKKITQQINGIKRSNTFIPWNRIDELTHSLHQIVQVIENDLFPQDFDSSIQLIEKLFNIDQPLLNRVDDSSGNIGYFYDELSKLWGKVWLSNDARNLSTMAHKIYDLLIHNDYGVRDNIIKDSAEPLGEIGLNTLEEMIIQNKNSFGKHSMSWMLEAIADGLNDVDKYIEVVKTNSVINEKTVCNIAKRLIKKGRSSEAIDWLLQQPNDMRLDKQGQKYDSAKVSYSDRFDLLLEAYDAETMIEESESLRWILFEKALAKKYYDGLIKNQPAKKIEAIKTRALKFVCEKSSANVGTVLSFLSEIQELDMLNSIILDRYDEMSEGDYYSYRPLSKKLATGGYPLAGCLLRRKLINGVLGRAISKYYKYAVSDLKLASDYAEKVNDWQGFQNHRDYMEKIKTEHARKSAFWALIKK